MIIHVGTRPAVWKKINLKSGLRSVTVRASCVYNGVTVSTKSRKFVFKVLK